MRIGLGISTTDSRTINENVYKYTSPETEIYIHTDTERKGVSHSRNACLSKFQHCDYIFLMDDDCYPIMLGWEGYFISIAEKYGFNHFTLPESFKSNIIEPHTDYHEYDGAIGCFRMITKKCLETIGGFNMAYDRYGFEDAGYTNRVHRAKLNGNYQFVSPARATSYIFSEDVYARNPNSNLSTQDKMFYINKNLPLYKEEINVEKLFYPYD